MMSILSLYFISRARSGAGIAIEKIIGSISFLDIFTFMGAFAITVGISALVSMNLGRIFSRIIYTINYTFLSICIIICLFLASFFISGTIGLLILSISVAIGLLTNSLGLKRSHLMSFIMIPMLLFIIGI